MRAKYGLLDTLIPKLTEEEKISIDKLLQLANEMLVTYDAVKKKLQRAKRKLLRGWVERLITNMAV